MKMSNNHKYEVLIKQYLRSILDISEAEHQQKRGSELPTQGEKITWIVIRQSKPKKEFQSESFLLFNREGKIVVCPVPERT